MIGVDGESPCPSDRWCLEPDSQELPATAPPYFRLPSESIQEVLHMFGQFNKEKFYITKE